MNPNPQSELPFPAAAPPRFVVTLQARHEDTGLIRIPLAITGKWVRGATTFAISREDLESIVRNFRGRQNGEINVDYDHASEMPEVAAGGPVPSAGRIVRLDAPEAAQGLRGRDQGLGETSNSKFQIPNPRFILYGWFEPTERARQLLENREYRFISPAIEWGAKSKRTGQAQGTTLTSVALTNRPFLEELPQIRLSDPEYVPVHEKETGNSKLETGNSKIDNRQLPVPNPVVRGFGPANRRSQTAATEGDNRNSKIENRQSPIDNPQFPVSSFEFRVSNQGGTMKHVNLSVEDGRIHINHEHLPEGFYFDPADLEAVGASRHVGTPLQLDAAALSESAVVSFAQARALLSEAEARGKFISAAEVFHAAAEQELEDAVRAGKVLPRQRDDWRKIALSDLPTFRKLMGAQKAVVPLAPVGLAGTPPSDVQQQIKFLAEQRMRERQVSYGQALADIGREQPDLMQQYRRAVSSHD
jgi:hypothetical protein